jgi:cytochrome c peroxidase
MIETIAPELMPSKCWPLLLVAVALASCSEGDKLFCNNGNCGWSDDEIAWLSDLTGLPDTAPPDPTNKYATNSGAVDLGHKLFFDARFSGTSAGTDSIGRSMPYGRAPAGQPLNISCATCHSFDHGGADPASVPGDVSLGAVWTDVNAPALLNAPFQTMITLSGRADSLWSEAATGMEGSIGGNRLRAAWLISTYYSASYAQVFTDWPLPISGAIADIASTLETSGPQAGQCILNPDCPAACRQVTDSSGSGATGCWPRFPLDGKPGSKAGCQPGDPTEPFGDAYDCMDPTDQEAITRVQVNFSKAIEAWELELVSNKSPFDAFMADVKAGHANDSIAISDDAKQGARLFVGRAGCSDCHNTPLLSDGRFYNIAVPQVGLGVPTLADCPQGGTCDCVTPNNCLPFGVYDGMQKLRDNPYNRTGMYSDDPTDTSRQGFINAPLDGYPKGAWRTPSLRNVELTPPYMHDGSYATLDEVVAHYSLGGDPNNAIGVPDARIKPLYLTTDEQSELVAFLRTLTSAPPSADIVGQPTLPQ